MTVENPNPQSKPRERLAAGVLFGLAIGDALAAPTEFMSMPQILSRFGKDGPAAPSSRVTDDTQMALAVGEALLEAPRPFTPTTLERCLRRRFVEWNESPENTRAPGTTCVNACNLLADGRDWIECTVLASKGCGANMRVAPVALLNFDRDGVTPRLRAAIAQFQAAMTHGHATALAASDLTAAAIADLLGGGDLCDLTERLREYIESQRHVYHEQWLGRLWDRPLVSSASQFIASGWSQCAAALDRVDEALSSEKVPVNVCEACGEGWVAEEALATALLCVLLHPNDPVRALRQAATTSGDSDSIAAIAGALAGAHHGISAWPADWVANIEYADRIERLASAWDNPT